jgi:hypothetical protein
MFTNKDRVMLQKMGIETGPLPETGTTKLLRQFGIPMTWENWIALECAGTPVEPDGEVQAEIDAATPGEVEAEPPEEFRMWDAEDICDAPSAGWCGEPSQTPVDPNENDEED